MSREAVRRLPANGAATATLAPEPPDTEPPPSELDRSLRIGLLHAAAAVERHMRRARHDAGVLDAEARALAVLRDRPGATVSELAGLCVLQQPTMTKTLDRLERRGWLDRLPEPRDRRVSRVRLRPEGEAVARRLALVEAEAEAALAARLRPGEWAELRQLLQALIGAADGQRQYRRRSPLRG